MTRHRLWLNTFMVIVLAQWAEHLAQAFQIYAPGSPKDVRCLTPIPPIRSTSP